MRAAVFSRALVSRAAGAGTLALLVLCSAVEASMAPAAPHMPKHVSHDANSVTMSWSPPLSPGAPIDGYEVQYRQQGKVGSWHVVPMSSAGVRGSTRHEVQRIETVCDRSSMNTYAHAITSGTFRIGLNTRGVNGFDTETKTLSANIPWDASADQMQEALQQLENVGCVHVKRETGLCTGCYRWEVEFRPKSDPSLTIGNPCPASSHGSKAIPTRSFLWTKAHPGGNIPLLVNRGDHIPNCRVVVAENQHSGGTSSLCHGNSGCSVQANNLEKFRYYHFRVRSHNAFGWSPWSGESDPVLTKGYSARYDAHGGLTHGGFDGSRWKPGDATHVFL